QRSRRYNRPLSAMMLDFDNFKTINDTYGHAVGDQVLVEVAEYCTKALRVIDIQGRYGGEELAFLLPETTNTGARQVAERLRQGIVDLVIMVKGHRLNITASIGVASFDTSSPSMEDFLMRSDKALYEAKRNGRNRVCAFLDIQVSPPSSDEI
ncbi:MAG: GGDEF domain-containing protein, partial [Desulfofustis sp.]|nr:GGDEF domain-containing protein [Desulfofustis sp.]